MSVPCAATLCTATLQAASRPATRALDDAGRHRRSSTAAAGPLGTTQLDLARLSRAVDVVARLGSLVTLCALLVLGGAVGGLVGGLPTGHDTTVTATFDGAGH